MYWLLPFLKHTLFVHDSATVCVQYGLIILIFFLTIMTFIGFEKKRRRNQSCDALAKPMQIYPDIAGLTLHLALPCVQKNVKTFKIFLADGNYIFLAPEAQCLR